jgi:L-asparaginase II
LTAPAGTVHVLRGGHVESVHRFAWRVCDAGGATLDAGGDAGDGVFARSLAKPFQALPAVRAGVLERFRLDDRDLAVACASHGGSTVHVARVAEILAACGLPERALGCGPLAPRDPAAAAALPHPPRRIHHNCSGKHALGLALCVAEGWPTASYLEAGHPLQRAMRTSVCEAAGGEASAEAVDGCGMRTFRLSLDGLAGAFARLAAGRLDAAGARAAAAMRAHPALVAYPGALDTEIMVAAPGAVAKIGAEGVLAVGTADGRGLAVKVLDGAGRALDPAVVLLVRERLGLPIDGPAIAALAAPALRNSRGDAVGRLEAALG